MNFNAFDNPYWKMTAKAIEDSQRIANHFSNHLKTGHTSMHAVASDATESCIKYMQECIKHPWLTTKHGAEFGKNYFSVIKSAVFQVAGKSVEAVVEPERGDVLLLSNDGLNMF